MAKGNAEYESIREYVEHLPKYIPLDRQTLLDLTQRIKSGDEGARTYFIENNLRLVVKIADDFLGRGLPLPDLVSAGNMGLMTAVTKYDPNRGANFATYSAWWIKQAMRKEIAEHSRTLKYASGFFGKQRQVRVAREKLGEDASIAEVASEARVQPSTVFGLEIKMLYLQGEDGEGVINTLSDECALNARDYAIQNDELQRLREAFARLDPRERQLMIQRYGLNGHRPKTLEQLSSVFGRTRERVRQIQNISLKKLRAEVVR